MDNIEKTRKNMKLSRPEFIRKFGLDVTENQLYLIEKGKAKVPQVRDAIKSKIESQTKQDNEFFTMKEIEGILSKEPEINQKKSKTVANSKKSTKSKKVIKSENNNEITETQVESLLSGLGSVLDKDIEERKNNLDLYIDMNSVVVNDKNNLFLISVNDERIKIQPLARADYEINHLPILYMDDLRFKMGNFLIENVNGIIKISHN